MDYIAYIYYNEVRNHYACLKHGDALIKDGELKKEGYRHVDTVDAAVFIANFMNTRDH